MRLLQVCWDAFDLHNAFIDQDSYGQGQATQRHDVDGLTAKPQSDY